MDPVCPMCQYDLRGLTEQRCPECGAPFDLESLQRELDRPRPITDPHGLIALVLLFPGFLMATFGGAGCGCHHGSAAAEALRWLPTIVIAASAFGLALRGARLGPWRDRITSWLALVLNGLWIGILATSFAGGAL